MKYFYKNEVLIIFCVFIVIYCQMFFNEYFNVLDDFEKSKNNIVYKVRFQTYKDEYLLQFLENYGIEYFDKVLPKDIGLDSMVEFVNESDYILKSDKNYNGELYGHVEDEVDLDSLLESVNFAISLDKRFKRISQSRPDIYRIYFNSNNGFEFVWPKSTSTILVERYSDNNEVIGYENEDVYSYGDVKKEVNVFDKSGKYHGVIGYEYNIENSYEFLKYQYDYIVKNDDKVLYSNIDDMDDTNEEKIEYYFKESQIKGNVDDTFVANGNYYYIYNFENGMQILQIVSILDIFLKAFKVTIPIDLIGISYLVFLAFKRNYEQSTEKLNDAMIELDTSYEKLKYMASTDFLTDMYNRAGFTQAVEECLENGNDIVFAIADIDKFKNVNDTYGHEIGDIVLKEFSSTLKHCIRNDDFVGRWGGEEFVIAFVNMSEKSAFNFTNELRKKVLDIKLDTGNEELLRISASFGVSYHNKKDDFLITITKADEALYYSKENGRNKVTRYSDII